MSSAETAEPQRARAAPSALSQLLGDAKDALIDELHERFREAGYGDIRPVHGAVFRHLPPNGIRLADLAMRAGMTAQSMGEHVGDLERLGYVVRVPDPRDRRARLIKPTARGLSAMMFAREALRAIEAAWAGAVGAQRVTELRATLEDIRRLRSG
jgi:MarR family transcriptional regulator, temperature-dependent positive regulator of motility